MLTEMTTHRVFFCSYETQMSLRLSLPYNKPDSLIVKLSIYFFTHLKSCLPAAIHNFQIV